MAGDEVCHVVTMPLGLLFGTMVLKLAVVAGQMFVFVADTEGALFPTLQTTIPQAIKLVSVPLFEPVAKPVVMGVAIGVTAKLPLEVAKYT